MWKSKFPMINAIWGTNENYERHQQEHLEAVRKSLQPTETEDEKKYTGTVHYSPEFIAKNPHVLHKKEKNMVVHELKTDVEFFRAVESGDKTFEIRYNDRGYQKGDFVILLPWEGSCFVEPYAGIKFVITYVIGFQQKEGWVVFGIKPVEF